MDLREQVIKYIKDRYGIEPEYPWYEYPDYATFKEAYSGKWFALIMRVENRKLGGSGDELVPVINVKSDTDSISILSSYPGYRSGYHMNKRHWLTVYLDGTVEWEEVLDRIDESYERIANTPTRRIYEAVKKVPRGYVATYGQVAELAGDKKMARAVGNALHKNPDPDSIPCYRIVNSKGELAGEFAFGGAGEQAKLLIADGIEVENGRVDLEKYGIKVSDGKLEGCVQPDLSCAETGRPVT